jgi:nucleoside-diphosphate-sugar epimerase
MNILVTGGCGYVGSSLVPVLLDKGNEVTVIDTQWFGLNLEKHPNLRFIPGDIRDKSVFPAENFDAVIHLANIANDPGVDLNPTLSWEVNVLGTYELLNWAKKHGVQDFIYASSGSVYGIKSEERVTEELELLPISTYNKTKMIAEEVMLNSKDYFRVINVRPATICGLSPRMRFDVAVNLLTYQALESGKIQVLGGSQIRPNLHIKDMVNVYLHFLENPTINSGSYNAGFENLTISQIADEIVKYIPAEINIIHSNDPRSYRQDSTKLQKSGFSPNYRITDAIKEIAYAYTDLGLRNNIMNRTVDRMLELELGNR